MTQQQQLRERYHFIHNVFANFYKDTLDYFSTTLYPRFEYRVVGTYDKAVEYIKNQCQYGRETDKPMLPAIILIPSGDFGPADGNVGGKQLWRYPNLAPSMIKRLFDPIYQDEHLIVHAGFMRIKGEMEIAMLLNSFYEYCDLRMLFFNTFGGLDRIIYPRFFSSFIILPESFVNYEYNNEFLDKSYKLQWDTADASNYLVRSTARNELILPLNIKPQYALTNLSDSSNRYGGSDNIPDWKLTATVSYEIELPNYLIIESDYLAQGINLEIGYGSVYASNNDYQPPENKIIYDVSWNWGLNPDTNSEKLDVSDTTSSIVFVGDFIFKHRYLHNITQQSIDDSTSFLIITLPEQILEPRILIINKSDRKLDFGVDYLIGDNGWSLIIDIEKAELVDGMILELYIYEKIGD